MQDAGEGDVKSDSDPRNLRYGEEGEPSCGSAGEVSVWCGEALGPLSGSGST